MSKESDKIKPIRGTMQTFTHFVTVGTTTIWTLRSKGVTAKEQISAYEHLVEFIGGLPRKIKKLLTQDMQKIDDSLKELGAHAGSNIHETLQIRSNEIIELLKYGKGRKLWFKMNDLLDKHGYKEIPNLRITSDVFKELELEEDED